jgi:hypothetical protein
VIVAEQIKGQLTMPPEIPAEKRGPCAWCGEPSVDELVIRKPRYTNHWNPIEKKMVRQMVKRAVLAPVCEHHLKTLELAG